MKPNPQICAACGYAFTQEPGVPTCCPNCGQMIVVDDVDESDPSGEVHAKGIAPESELEEIKIRRIVRERRAMIRTRSYYVVLVLGCVVAAGQLLLRIAQSRMRPTERIGYIAAILLLLLVGLICLKRFQQISQHLKDTRMKDPATPPDFRGLSDGSHHARDLDNLQE